MLTLALTYYRQPQMLAKHCETWLQYPQAVRDAMDLVIVDDGSPEPALPVIEQFQWRKLPRVYRIDPDIPWNYLGARNLAAYVAEGRWHLRLDLDHELPVESAEALVACLPTLEAKRWYRLRRFRVGRADETRRKDAIPEDAEFGEIKPHVDTFLCTRELFWAAGGYDEDFAGSLGGSSLLTSRLEAEYLRGELPDTVALHVHTRHSVPDANVSALDRDTSRYRQLRAFKASQGYPRASNPLRFQWKRVM